VQAISITINNNQENGITFVPTHDGSGRLVHCFGLYTGFTGEIQGRIVKIVKVLLILGLLVSMSVAGLGLLTSKSPTNLNGLQEIESKEASFIPHSPITISGNSDFVSQGWPGDGSPLAPYIIESLEIAADSTCISISNTDVHFIVRNCTLSSTIVGENAGIYFSHVGNGTVENCTISYFDTGISQGITEDCTVSNNTIIDCTDYGIYLYSGLNCIFDNNTIVDCGGYGMYLNRLRMSGVGGNTIFNCKEMGLAIVTSPNVTLTDNVIINGGRFGLYLSSTANCTFANNTLEKGGFGIGGNLKYWIHEFSENTVNGKSFGYFCNTNDTEIDGSLFGQVFLVSCFNVSLSTGIFFNASVGVNLVSCTNCTIDSVGFDGNLYGINLIHSENTTLTNNVFVNCGVRLEGEDVKFWTITASGNTVNGKSFGYFLKQDDLVISGNDYGQLILVDSDHLSISNGIFESVTIGFAAYSCFNCSISDALFVNNYREAISLLNSNNCTVTNVTCEGSRGRGLYLVASNNTIVAESEIHGNGDGIWISSSDDFLFESNQIHSNRGNPIYLSGTNYGMIENNSIHNNGGSLRLYVVNWLEIINNTISGGTTDGVYMDFTSGVVIVGNKIYGHAGFGLNVRSYALFSEIYNNMIGFNGLANAVDIGIFNEWDDGINTGNVWSDYSGEGVYSVSGLSVDNYPLGFLTWQDDVQYVVGSAVPAITWDVRLPNPDSYTILWDGTTIAQGSLNSSLDYLSKPIEGLSIGGYNLTLIVNDESGYNLVDTVIIDVVEESVTTTTTPTTTTTSPTTTTDTTTTSTNTDSTTGTLPPPDTPMMLIIMAVGVAGLMVIVLFLAIRKK
jgi:parallel beta-helix repeat protein